MGVGVLVVICVMCVLWVCCIVSIFFSIGVVFVCWVSIMVDRWCWVVGIGNCIGLLEVSNVLILVCDRLLLNRGMLVVVVFCISLLWVVYG